MNNCDPLNARTKERGGVPIPLYTGMREIGIHFIVMNERGAYTGPGVEQGIDCRDLARWFLKEGAKKNNMTYRIFLCL